jgi:hypothetical protein
LKTAYGERKNIEPLPSLCFLCKVICAPYLNLHYFYSMNLEWLKTGIGPLKDLITFLNKEGKTTDILKRQVIRELRNNLNIFHNGYLNNVSQDVMIDMLSNDAVKEAIRENFRFKKLKPGRIEPYHVFDERNKKYTGWDAERLVDKIDEKIEELKNIKKMNNASVENVKNNITLMLSNLYYRMKLLADFIRSDMK